LKQELNESKRELDESKQRETHHDQQALSSTTNTKKSVKVGLARTRSVKIASTVRATRSTISTAMWNCKNGLSFSFDTFKWDGNQQSKSPAYQFNPDTLLDIGTTY